MLSFVCNFYGRRLDMCVGETRWTLRRGKEESRGRLDAVVVQFGTTPGTRGHPSQGAGRGEQWEWEMSTRSRRKSLGRVPGSGCVKARHRCGTEEVPVLPGPTHGPGPRKSDLVRTVWKGELDLPVDRQVLRVLGARIGTQEHVMRQLNAKSTEHAVLLDSRCGSRPSSLVFSLLPWFDPCELQFEDGQTTAGAAVCGDGQLAPQTTPKEQTETQHFHSRLEVWVWEVQSEPKKPHIGRVVPT